MYPINIVPFLKDVLITIVVPTYQGSPLVKETLESVLNQSSSDWSCLVVDDSQREIPPREISSFFEDVRFSWLKREGAMGANGARNTGLRACRGGLVSFLDDDDLLSPSAVENRLCFVEEFPDSDLWIFPNYSFRQVPGDQNQYACFPEKSLDSDVTRLFRVQHPWITSGPLWTKSFLVQIGGWNEELVAWQDWELNLRALLVAPQYVRSKDGDNFRRKGNRERKTISSQTRSFAEMKAILDSINSLFVKSSEKGLVEKEDRAKCLKVFLSYSSLRLTLRDFLKLSSCCFGKKRGGVLLVRCFLYHRVRRVPILKDSEKAALILPLNLI